MPRNKHKRNRECVAVVHWLFHWVVAPKAWFKRRTLHVPNLIIKFGACEVRRMNQLGLTVFYLGQSAVLFDWACPIERQKIDFDSYVDLYMCRTKCIHYAYIMHTLCIHYINNFSHNPACFYVVAMRRRLNLRKWRVKKNNVAPLVLTTQNILV